MPKSEEEKPLQERREELRKVVEQAIALVEPALAHLTSARATLAIEPAQDGDEGYPEMLCLAASHNALAASFGLGKAEGVIDDLLMPEDEDTE